MVIRGACAHRQRLDPLAGSKARPSRVRGVKERLKVLVPPELLAGGVAAWRGAERGSSPAAFTARHVCDIPAVKVGLRVTPYIGERTVRRPAGDNTAVLVAAFAFADLASPVEEHGTRILRLAERKMNIGCSNG